MGSDGCFRRLSVPEFSHGKGLEIVPKGIFQKFRSSTLTGSSGRDEAASGKDVQYAGSLSQGIVYNILPENPFLKGIRSPLSFLFEPSYSLQFVFKPFLYFFDF